MGAEGGRPQTLGAGRAVGGPLAAVRSFRLTPFASTAFRWLWLSSLGTASATGMLSIATAWLAVDEGSGGFGVGVVLAARLVPNLLFGLAAGTFADRFERTRQLVAVSLAALPLMLVLNRLAVSGSVPLWQLTLLSFATGCLSVFDVPARSALVVDVVPRALAPNAMALNALAARLCTALGAFVAGLLIPVIGVAACYLVVAGAYIVSAGFVLAVRQPVAVKPIGVRPTFLRAIGEGARLIVDVPAVRTLVAAGVACEIFGFSYLTALPIVARDVLSSGAEGLGTLNAAASIGGAVTVVLLSVLPGASRREPLLGLVFVVYGAALMVLSASTSLAIAALVMLVVGACAAAFDLLQQTLLQLAVPEDQRGRAVGVWVLSVGSGPVGHLEMGSVVASLGAPAALLVNGAVVVAAALILLARVPLFRPGKRAVSPAR
jgi:MFS family permease